MSADVLVAEEAPDDIRLHEGEGIHDALARDLDGPVGVVERAAQMDATGREEAGAEREALGGVVVSGDDHGRNPEGGEAREGIVEEGDSLGRRDGAIVDVAGDDDGVWTGVLRDRHQAIEHPSLIREKRFLVERTAEVPVRRVEDAETHCVTSYGGG
jgi:hypothetical protein